MREWEKNIVPGQPFKLPNGTEVRPTEDGTPEVVKEEEVQAENDIDEVLEDPFEEDTGGFVRTLADVRVEAAQFNPVMLILAYSMWGLEAHSIARLLNQDLDVIKGVMASELFTDTRKQILEAIRYTEASTIHGFLTQKARKAAIKMAAALNSKSDDNRIAAAKDILDRAGFRPADRVEHSHRFEDELRIVMVEETKSPEIEVEIN